jgi:hypothetical protein
MIDRRSQIPDWLEKLAGAGAFSAYLRALGRDATVAALPPRVPEEDAGAVSVRDRHLVWLTRSPIHLVSLRLGEARGETCTFWLAYHYVVRVADSRDSDRYDARVGQSFGGVFCRKRTRLTFVGGRLADRLRADDAVRSALFQHLGPRDDLAIAADRARGLVRIVHTRPMSVRRPLWLPHPSAFFEGFLPEPLLVGFERVAKHVRALPSLPDRTEFSSA